MRDDKNKMRAKCQAITQELDDTKQELQRWLNRENQVSLENDLERYKDFIKEQKRYIAQLEKSTLLARQNLKETMIVKLRYEKIFKKLLRNEQKGKTEKVVDVAARTPPEEHEALESLEKVLPPQIKSPELSKKLPLPSKASSPPKRQVRKSLTGSMSPTMQPKFARNSDPTKASSPNVRKLRSGTNQSRSPSLLTPKR